MTYRQFTEHNDHEGEHWHFWIPIERNRQTLTRLKDYLDGWHGENDAFHLEGRDLSEVEVDLLVEYAYTDGRFPDHTKLEGVLCLPAELEEYSPSHWFFGTGIQRYFEVPL